MEKTDIYDLGLHPLDQRQASVPGPTIHYTEYWRNLYDNVVPQLLGRSSSADDMRRYYETDDYLSWVSHNLLPAGLQGKRLIVPKSISGLSELRGEVAYITAWNARLGNFNPLHGASEDLGLAASRMLQLNGMSRRGGEDPSLRPAPSSVRSAVLHYPLHRQPPTKTLLTAGELTYKAALIEEQPSRQDYLFRVAEGIFDRIGACDLPIESAVALQGFRYGADIKFQRAYRQARTAFQQGRDERIRPAVAELHALLGQDAIRFSRLQKLVKLGKIEEGDGSGRAFEQLIRLILREQTVLDLPRAAQEPDAPYFAVRSAHVSEDNSYLSAHYKQKDRNDRWVVRKLLPGFDITVQEIIGDTVVYSQAVQLKRGDSTRRHRLTAAGRRVPVRSGHSGNSRKDEYLPGIMVLDGRALSTEQAEIAVQIFTQRYTQGKPMAFRKNDPIADFRQEIQSLLAA